MRYVPPPFGTGSPAATTRGLEETPYLGSTRLANLFDEAQLASTRHIAATAAPRAAQTTGSDGRIPIRPNYHPAGWLPTSRQYRQRVPTRPTKRIKLRGYRIRNTAEMG